MNAVALNILAQYLSSVLWGIYIGLEQLSQGMCMTSGSAVADSFPKWLHHVPLPPVASEHFRCSTASPIFFILLMSVVLIGLQIIHISVLSKLHNKTLGWCPFSGAVWSSRVPSPWLGRLSLTVCSPATSLMPLGNNCHQSFQSPYSSPCSFIGPSQQTDEGRQAVYVPCEVSSRHKIQPCFSLVPVQRPFTEFIQTQLTDSPFLRRR